MPVSVSMRQNERLAQCHNVTLLEQTIKFVVIAN